MEITFDEVNNIIKSIESIKYAVDDKDDCIRIKLLLEEEPIRMLMLTVLKNTTSEDNCIFTYFINDERIASDCVNFNKIINAIKDKFWEDKETINGK